MIDPAKDGGDLVRDQIVDSSDQEVAFYIAQLLLSLQKLCDNRGMSMLSHLLNLARREAGRLSSDG
jgi:hypothetical protein